MRRNPFLFIVLCLIVLGALFFRYLSPERSTKIIQVAEQMQNKASEVVQAVAATAIPGKKDQEPMSSEEKLLPLDEESDKVAESIEDIQEEVSRAPVQQASLEQGANVEEAIVRANKLLQEAMQSAKDAQAQIEIVRRELEGLNQMRASLNPKAIKNSKKTQAATPQESSDQKATDITPNSNATQIEKVLAENTVRFNWTKSILTEDALVKIANVAELMEKNPQISVRIIGHTDANGTEDLNSWLGLIRAKRVREKLVSLGVNPKRLSVSSRGAKEPLDTNDTAEGRWKNRRVEFALSEK